MLITTDENPSNLGYYMVDQRATGIPVSHGRPLFESATYTCRHCERVVVMEMTRTRPRYKCFGCSHLICDPCAAEKISVYGGRCVTYAQKLDQILTQETRQSGVESPIVLP
jgi:hypothetical protein